MNGYKENHQAIYPKRRREIFEEESSSDYKRSIKEEKG